MNDFIKNTKSVINGKPYAIMKDTDFNSDSKRNMLINNINPNFNAAKKRCEIKYGKDNCIKKGKFAYVYACDEGYAPYWTDDK